MDTAALTIAAAARLCGVDRRTLQRAIHAGRLALDAQHCLSREDLRRAGYLTTAAPQGHATAAPHLDAADTPHQVERLTMAIEALVVAVEALRQQLASQPAPEAPQRHHLRHAAVARRSDAAPYDPATALARMQALRQEGLSLAQIAAALNTEGIATRHGKPWHKGTVGYLLQGREG